MKCQEESNCELRADQLLWSVEGSGRVCFNHWVLAFSDYRDQLHRGGFTQFELDWFNKYV